MADKGNSKGRSIGSTTVAALQCPPGTDRAFIWDDKIAGFGVVAFESGKKVYVYQYRHNGRSKRLTLGRHGAITPDKARKLAKINAGLVASGKDPMGQRRVDRGVRSFRDLADDYLRLHVKPKR